MRGRFLLLPLALALALPPVCAQDHRRYECETAEQWGLRRFDRKPVTSARFAVEGKGIRFTYDRSDPNMLYHQVPLQDLRELRFSLRSESAAPLAILVEDEERALFWASARVPPRVWVEVRVEPGDFELHPRSPVKKDRLDPARLREGYGIADTTPWLEPGRPHGNNGILIDTVWVRRATPAPAPDRADKPAQSKIPPRPWIRDEGNPRIVPDFEVAPGAPAVRAVSGPSVLFDPSDQTWKMWFTATWVEDGKVRAGIKYAQSQDGLRWAVEDGLALGPSTDADAWDHSETGAPTVVFQPDAPADRRYALFYAGANHRGRQEGSLGTHRIGAAFSAFGRRFTRLSAEESPHGQAGLVLTPRDAMPDLPDMAGGLLADPEAVHREDGLHLWFTLVGVDRAGEIRARGIGYASSRDGVRWIPSGANPLASLAAGGRDDFPIRPVVVWRADRAVFEIWFAGRESGADPSRSLPGAGGGFRTCTGYWSASSPNGVDWTLNDPATREFTHDAGAPGEGDSLLADADVIFLDGEYRIYYGAVNGRSSDGPHKGDPLTGLNIARAK